MHPLVPVVTSAESAARDASAIAAGTPGRALMQRAGAAAAAEIAHRFFDRLAQGALVFAGPGNNGGDAWVVARALAVTGVRVRVVEPFEAKTDDARFERARALELDRIAHDKDIEYRGEAVVVDGLLGTGATGAPRGSIADAVHVIGQAREHGACVVALDVPTGLDASTGVARDAVRAHLTLSFGSVKRGHLIARGLCGVLVVLDIGLEPAENTAPLLVDDSWVAACVPPVSADAHKGTRKKLAVIGGAEGMAGASVLAARAALRSGIGMVKLVVAHESLPPVQEAEPVALAAAWPPDDATARTAIADWADAIVIGPGLSRTDDARAVLERVLRSFQGPAVLDADALNTFAGDLNSLRTLLAGRRALLTPHPAELGRLVGASVDEVLARRFEIGGDVAKACDAVVLLKGVPTVLSSPDGRRLVSASGTPVLATAGSGDVLSGIAGTLLAQVDDALHAGAAAAWIHGRASEIAGGDGASGTRVRGFTLHDVIEALPRAWSAGATHGRSPVLAELPAVGESAT